QRPFAVPTRRVVNATGIWTERVAALAGPSPFRITLSKGTHLVLDRSGLVDGAALVIPETDDGRLAFLVPWRGRLILGTTDEAYQGDPRTPLPAASEARYLLEHLNRYLRAPIGPEAMVGAYAGVRPLIARADASPSELSRGPEVVEHAGGLISIIGGKLTIYRKMAEDTVDVLARRDGLTAPCRTADLVLEGGAHLEASRRDAGRRGEALGLTGDQVGHLVASFGSGALTLLELIEGEPDLARPFLPDLPVLRAELVVACREEGAQTLTDWMVLRSRLALLDRHQGRGCAREAAALMGRELGWSGAEEARQVAAFEKAIDAETAFRTSLERA
ncbi:MAG: glycerol-3-phosphate dehydrogenase/oxidase, partial [Anaerolineales bacterium]